MDSPSDGSTPTPPSRWQLLRGKQQQKQENIGFSFEPKHEVETVSRGQKGGSASSASNHQGTASPRFPASSREVNDTGIRTGDKGSTGDSIADLRSWMSRVQVEAQEEANAKFKSASSFSNAAPHDSAVERNNPWRSSDLPPPLSKDERPHYKNQRKSQPAHSGEGVDVNSGTGSSRSNGGGGLALGPTSREEARHLLSTWHSVENTDNRGTAPKATIPSSISSRVSRNAFAPTTTRASFGSGPAASRSRQPKAMQQNTIPKKKLGMSFSSDKTAPPLQAASHGSGNYVNHDDPAFQGLFGVSAGRGGEARACDDDDDDEYTRDNSSSGLVSRAEPGRGTAASAASCRHSAPPPAPRAPSSFSPQACDGFEGLFDETAEEQERLRRLLAFSPSSSASSSSSSSSTQQQPYHHQQQQQQQQEQQQQQQQQQRQQHQQQKRRQATAAAEREEAARAAAAEAAQAAAQEQGAATLRRRLKRVALGRTFTAWASLAKASVLQACKRVKRAETWERSRCLARCLGSWKRVVFVVLRRARSLLSRQRSALEVRRLFGMWRREASALKRVVGTFQTRRKWRWLARCWGAWSSEVRRLALERAEALRVYESAKERKALSAAQRWWASRVCSLCFVAWCEAAADSKAHRASLEQHASGKARIAAFVQKVKAEASAAAGAAAAATAGASPRQQQPAKGEAKAEEPASLPCSSAREHQRRLATSDSNDTQHGFSRARQQAKTVPGGRGGECGGGAGEVSSSILLRNSEAKTGFRWSPNEADCDDQDDEEGSRGSALFGRREESKTARAARATKGEECLREGGDEHPRDGVGEDESAPPTEEVERFLVFGAQQKQLQRSDRQTNNVTTVEHDNSRPLRRQYQLSSSGSRANTTLERNSSRVLQQQPAATNGSSTNNGSRGEGEGRGVGGRSSNRGGSGSSANGGGGGSGSGSSGSGGGPVVGAHAFSGGRRDSHAFSGGRRDSRAFSGGRRDGGTVDGGGASSGGSGSSSSSRSSGGRGNLCTGACGGGDGVRRDHGTAVEGRVGGRRKASNNNDGSVSVERGQRRQGRADEEKRQGENDGSGGGGRQKEEEEDRARAVAASQLAAMHYSRATLLYHGFGPWKNFLNEKRLDQIKADGFYRDASLLRSFRAWCRLKALNEHAARKRRGERLVWCREFCARRARGRAWGRWRRQVSDLQARALAVTEERARRLKAACVAAWRGAAVTRAEDLHRKAKRTRRLCALRRARHAFAAWRAALQQKREEGEAERRRTEKWQKVRGWLGE